MRSAGSCSGSPDRARVRSRRTALPFGLRRPASPSRSSCGDPDADVRGEVDQHARSTTRWRGGRRRHPRELIPQVASVSSAGAGGRRRSTSCSSATTPRRRSTSATRNAPARGRARGHGPSPAGDHAARRAAAPRRDAQRVGGCDGILVQSPLPAAMGSEPRNRSSTRSTRRRTSTVFIRRMSACSCRAGRARAVHAVRASSSCSMREGRAARRPAGRRDRTERDRRQADGAAAAAARRHGDDLSFADAGPGRGGRDGGHPRRRDRPSRVRDARTSSSPARPSWTSASIRLDRPTLVARSSATAARGSRTSTRRAAPSSATCTRRRRRRRRAVAGARRRRTADDRDAAQEHADRGRAWAPSAAERATSVARLGL